MNDRRKHERQHLAFFTRIYDRETGQMLGNLANLTNDGIMLIADEPVEINRLYKIHMELDEAILKKDHLNFEARCLWCGPDPLSDLFYNAGFQFSQIDAPDLEIIRQITHQYRLRD